MRPKKFFCSRVSKWPKILEFPLEFLKSRFLSMTVHVGTAGHQVPFVVTFANGEGGWKTGKVEKEDGLVLKECLVWGHDRHR